MPFALVIIGLIMIVTGARDTYKDLGTTLVGDFTGENNFLYWLTAMSILGGIGAIKPLRPVSHAFMALLILVLFLSKGDPKTAGGGFFDKFIEAIGIKSDGSAADTAKLVGSSSTAASSVSDATNLWAGAGTLPALPSLPGVPTL